MIGEVVIHGTAIALDIWWNLHARFFQRPNGEWKIGRYEDERGYSLRYKFCINRRFGKPVYPTEPQRLKVYKLMEAKYERMTIDEILASDITILDYEAAVSRSMAPTTSVNRRSKPMTNETTKQVTEKAPKANFGQCQVVPLATSKAGATRCPRMVMTQNEYGACGGHLAFIKRGSETRLLDGRVINPKPQVTPKADTDGAPVAGALAHALNKASEGTRIDLSTPSVPEPAKQDAITPIAPAVPESTAGANPAPKLTKKQKAQSALAILSAKHAAKNDAAVDTGMVQRSLPEAK
jgi:hypothetical protein